MLCPGQSASKIRLESILFPPPLPALFVARHFRAGPGTSLSLLVTCVLLVFSGYFYALIVLNCVGLIFMHRPSFVTLFLTLPAFLILLMVTCSFSSKNEPAFAIPIIRYFSTRFGMTYGILFWKLVYSVSHPLFVCLFVFIISWLVT